MNFAALGSPRTAALVEQYWACPSSGSETVDPEKWAGLLAASKVGWQVARRWIEGGRPLSLIALELLKRYARSGPPSSWQAPAETELKEVLERSAAGDDAPRAMSSRKTIRKGMSNRVRIEPVPDAR